MCKRGPRGKGLIKKKTSIFFSRNTRQEVRYFMIQLVGIPVSQHFDTYLGLPALVGNHG